MNEGFYTLLSNLRRQVAQPFLDESRMNLRPQENIMEVDGFNIFSELTQGVKAFREEDFVRVGEKFAEAAKIIIEGKKEAEAALG